MSIGAKDFIDKLLVEKYAQEKVDNHESDSLVSKVTPDDMLTAMSYSSDSYRMMLALNAKLTRACYGVVAKSAKYIQTEAMV